MENIEEDKTTLSEEERNRRNSIILSQKPLRRLEILRLDYTFSVMVPLIMAIYLNNLNIMAHIDLLAGFFLFAITGNTLNDMLDARKAGDNEAETIERIRGFHWKELATISITAFIFGSMLFSRTTEQHPQNLFILAIIVIMVVLYCVKKNIPVVNQILLGISHVFLPYLMIKIDAGTTPLLTGAEWFLMTTFFFFAFTGQIVHEIIDGDSITRFKPKVQQIIVLSSSVATIILGIITVFITSNIYFIPFVIIPIGSIYTFRKPTHSTKGVKDVGIILGNVILVYFLVLIFRAQFYIV